MDFTERGLHLLLCSAGVLTIVIGMADEVLMVMSRLSVMRGRCG